MSRARKKFVEQSKHLFADGQSQMKHQEFSLYLRDFIQDEIAEHVAGVVGGAINDIACELARWREFITEDNEAETVQVLDEDERLACAIVECFKTIYIREQNDGE